MNQIQSVIQFDLLAGASLEVEHDEQLEFVDYVLAAHCGFAPFNLADEVAPWAVVLNDVEVKCQ